MSGGKIKKARTPEPWEVSIAIALQKLGDLMRYIVEDNYMSDQDAQDECAEAMEVLANQVRRL